MPEPPNKASTPATPAEPAEQAAGTEGAANAAPSLSERAAHYRERGWSSGDAWRAALAEQDYSL